MNIYFARFESVTHIYTYFIIFTHRKNIETQLHVDKNSNYITERF